MSLKEDLRTIIKEEYPDEPNWHGFTRWWLSAMGYDYRSNPNQVKFVDGKDDGGIDAIAFPIEDPRADSIFIVQSKFYSQSPTRGDLSRFMNAVMAIRGSQAEFLDWLQTCRYNLHEDYEKIRGRRKRCKFYVVVPCSIDRNLYAELKKENIEVHDFEKVRSLYKQYQAGRSPRLGEMKLKYHSKPVVIAKTDSVNLRIFTIKASELARAYRDHKEKLFSGNIRYALRGQTPRRVKKGIEETLIDYPEQLVYSHNGITIVGYGVRQKNSYLQILSPSIVNGAQTISFLGQPNILLKTLKSHALIIARLIEVKDSELLGDIETDVAYRSNNQNKVNPSDLMIDLPELVSLQRYLLRHKIFMERKKGEIKPFYCRGAITKERLAQILASSKFAKGASDAKRLQDLFVTETASKLFKEYANDPDSRLEAVAWVRINGALLNAICLFSNKTRKRRAQLAQFAAITVLGRLLRSLGIKQRFMKAINAWESEQEAVLDFLVKSFKVIFSELLRVSSKEKKNEPAFYKSKESLEKAIDKATYKSKTKIRKIYYDCF